MKLEDMTNYWWYKLHNSKGSIDYVYYKAESRDEANSKIDHDIRNKHVLWPLYFSTHKNYRRKVADIVSYKPCSWHEVQFVAIEKSKKGGN